MHSMIHTIPIECDDTRTVEIRSSTQTWADFWHATENPSIYRIYTGNFMIGLVFIE